MSNYRMNGYDSYCNHDREYSNRCQNGFENNYSTNYGWNYYPQTEDNYNAEEDYDRDEFSFKQKQNKDCERENEGENVKVKCRHNNFSCFPSFPCFKRRNIDCRKTRPCFDFDRCNNGWGDNRPCGNNGGNNWQNPHEHNCQRNNRFYFSGCIEFKNFDRKF